MKAIFLTMGCILALGGALANPRAAVIATTGPGEGRGGREVRDVMSPARYAMTGGFSVALGCVFFGIGLWLPRSSALFTSNTGRDRF